MRSRISIATEVFHELFLDLAKTTFVALFTTPFFFHTLSVSYILPFILTTIVSLLLSIEVKVAYNRYSKNIRKEDYVSR